MCIWKKKKNDGFWMNRGFEIKRDYIGKKQKNHGVGTNCVIGRRRKMMGFGQTVDLKYKRLYREKAEKSCG